MWGGGIAPTDMRSNSHLMSARGSLLRFITTQTTMTTCWTVCRKMPFGAYDQISPCLTRTKVLFST